MILFYLFAVLLLANVSTISSTSQADCSCSLYMDSAGFGKCKKTFAQLNNNFVCFVNEPTTCSDAHAIGSNPVRYLSADACKESYDTDRDTNGLLTDDDFNNAENARFNSPPNTSDVFDQDLFEGDIELEGIGDVTNITRRKWPKADDGYVYIPISFPATASVKEKAAIARTVIEFRNKSCIRLRPFNATTDQDYIHINTRGFGCQSPIGRKGGPQVIRAHDCINNGGSWGRVCHEVMHSIGFYHEQSRPDRDDYVSILWDELKQVEREDFLFRIERNYEKCTSCTTYGRYDIRSIMHYPSAFGSKNRTVIQPKEGACPDDEECIMGQRSGLSKLDVEDIQNFYQCDLSFSQHEAKLEKQKTELCLYIDCEQQTGRDLCPDTCKRDATCTHRASNAEIQEFSPKFYDLFTKYADLYADQNMQILQHLSSTGPRGLPGLVSPPDSVGPKNEAATQVDGNWGAWSGWSECPVICDGGESMRYRFCDDPPPEYGGANCTGNATLVERPPSNQTLQQRENKACIVNPCPVDCEWGNFSEWSICSKTCGGGEKYRTRQLRIFPQNGGDSCTGNATEKRSCNTYLCPARVLVTASCPGTVERGINYIWSPNYPKKYGYNDNCTWKLDVRPGTHIRLTPDHFSVEGYEGKDCSKYDFVKIYDLTDATEEMIGSYCNKENPLTEAILSKGNSLKVHFTANNNWSVWKGFKIQYSSAEPVACKWSSWSNWTSCSTTCVGGKRVRIRSEITSESNRGEPCKDIKCTAEIGGKMENCNEQRTNCNEEIPCHGCSSKVHDGYCAIVGEECWCFFSQTTYPFDVCGHPNGYGGRYYSIGKKGTDTVHLPWTIIKAVGKKPSLRCVNSQTGCMMDSMSNTCHGGCHGSTLTHATDERRWRRTGYPGIVRCTNMEG